MIILLGGGGAGKTTIQNELIKRGYKRGILYTTRNKRKKEIHGRDYMFVSKSEFEHLKVTKKLIATTKVGNGEYGIHENFCDEDAVLVTNIEMIEELKKNTDYNITTIYVKTTDEQRRERLQKRGSTREEIEEKIQRNNSYQEIEEEYADFIVENDKLQETIEKIQEIQEIIRLCNKSKANIKITDAHSHIGFDYLFGNAKLDDYISFCKQNGITQGNVMPQPNPAYVIKGKVIPCINWTYKGGKIEYDTYDHKNQNPYKYINYYYYNQCKENKDFDVNFIPLIHPVLDQIEYLENLISDIKPNAIKIHGIGSGIAPKDIPKRFIEILKKYDLPVIVHVECDTRENTTHTEQKKYIKRVNNAFDWAEFLAKNELRGLLTHGLALDKKAIELIKDNKNIMIGIGPDLLISNQPHRLKTAEDADKYLQILKENISANQIIFDIDFNWNIDPKTNEIDNGAVERIKQTWENSGEQKKIFHENAELLYNRDRITNKRDERKGENR